MQSLLPEEARSLLLLLLLLLLPSLLLPLLLPVVEPDADECCWLPLELELEGLERDTPPMEILRELLATVNRPAWDLLAAYLLGSSGCVDVGRGLTTADTSGPRRDQELDEEL